MDSNIINQKTTQPQTVETLESILAEYHTIREKIRTRRRDAMSRNIASKKADLKSTMYGRSFAHLYQVVILDDLYEEQRRLDEDRSDLDSVLESLTKLLEGLDETTLEYQRAKSSFDSLTESSVSLAYSEHSNRRRRANLYENRYSDEWRVMDICKLCEEDNEWNLQNRPNAYDAMYSPSLCEDYNSKLDVRARDAMRIPSSEHLIRKRIKDAESEMKTPVCCDKHKLKLTDEIKRLKLKLETNKTDKTEQAKQQKQKAVIDQCIIELEEEKRRKAERGSFLSRIFKR